MPLGKNTKSYETPNHPYQGERIAQEHSVIAEYGLKNKEELWRAESELRSLRREARALLGRGDADQTDRQGGEFLARLKRYGFLGQDDGLDDILSLTVTDILERRLQTIVYRKGLSNSTKQARQFINHGHIVVDDERVRTPSYQVAIDEEDSIGFDTFSPLADDLHPERAEEQ